MIKHRSQLIVLVGACIVWGQIHNPKTFGESDKKLFNTSLM